MAFGFGNSVVASAVVTLDADTSGLTSGLKRADDSLSRTSRNTQTHTSAMGRSFGLLKGAAAIGGAVAGFQVLSSAAGAVWSQFTDGQRVTAQTAAVLKSTGGAANVTQKQVEDLAGAISRKTGIDDQQVQSSENMLLTFTKVRNEVGKGNDIFNQATKTVTDMSVALGEDSKSASIQLGKALNDPIKGVTALQRVGVSFTEGQKKQIKAMVDSGHTMQAQKLILGELNNEFGGSAVAYGNTFPGMVSKAKNAVLNFSADLVGKAIPVLVSVVQWAIKEWPKVDKALQEGYQAAKPTIEQLRQLFFGVVDDIKAVVALIRRHWDEIGPIVNAVLKLVKGLLVDWLHYIADVIKLFNDLVHGRWSAVWRDLKSIAGDILKLLLDLIRNWRTYVLAVFSALWDAVKALAIKGWNGLKGVIADKARDIRGVISGLKNDVTGLFSDLWNSIESKANSAWNSILRTIAGWVNRLIDVYNEIPFVDNIDHVTFGSSGGGRSRGGGGGGGGVHKHAKGAIVPATPGGVYMVAEGGYPEAVLSLDPKHKSRTLDLVSTVMKSLGVVPQFGLGGIVGGVAGGVTSAAGAISGAAQSAYGIVTDPIGFLKSHLPAIPSLRGEMGDVVRGFAKKVIQEAISSLGFGGGGASSGLIGRAMYAAERISALHLPYVWGGGHQSSPAPMNGPFDCSGFVSAVLQQAGIRIPTMVSGQFMNWGQAGRGALEVLASPEHVYMGINGRYFGTSSFNPGGGPGPLPYGERSGFSIRHYADGGLTQRGWSWVGERGPELMYMRGNEGVVPNSAFGPTIVIQTLHPGDSRTLRAIHNIVSAAHDRFASPALFTPQFELGL